MNILGEALRKAGLVSDDALARAEQERQEQEAAVKAARTTERKAEEQLSRQMRALLFVSALRDREAVEYSPRETDLAVGTHKVCATCGAPWKTRAGRRAAPVDGQGTPSCRCPDRKWMTK